jgi:hypothetical protein
MKTKCKIAEFFNYLDTERNRDTEAANDIHRDPPTGEINEYRFH